MKTNIALYITNIFLCIVFILLLCSCSSIDNADFDSTVASIESEEFNTDPAREFFNISYNEGMYYYSIYDVNGNVIYAGNSYNEPEIILHEDNIVSLVIQSGTGPSTRKGLFFDVENSVSSKEFYYVLDYSSGLVVYGDEKSNIVIESVFDDAYYQTILYSQLNNPASDIPDLIMDGDLSEEKNSVTVTYVSADHNLVTQTFNLDSDVQSNNTQ